MSHALTGGCNKIGTAGVLSLDLKEVPKGTLVESADGMELRQTVVGLTVQGGLDRLEGWTTGNLCNSGRRGCAPGKVEPIEKIKAEEETTQGTPLWKGPQKAWKLGRSLGKAPLVHYTYTYYFSYQGAGNDNNAFLELELGIVTGCFPRARSNFMNISTKKGEGLSPSVVL